MRCINPFFVEKKAKKLTLAHELSQWSVISVELFLDSRMNRHVVSICFEKKKKKKKGKGKEKEIVLKRLMFNYVTNRCTQYEKEIRKIMK